jgi:hypothetical protein
MNPDRPEVRLHRMTAGRKMKSKCNEIHRSAFRVFKFVAQNGALYMTPPNQQTLKPAPGYC